MAKLSDLSEPEYIHAYYCCCSILKCILCIKRAAFMVQPALDILPVIGLAITAQLFNFSFVNVPAMHPLILLCGFLETTSTPA